LKNWIVALRIVLEALIGPNCGRSDGGSFTGSVSSSGCARIPLGEGLVSGAIPRCCTAIHHGSGSGCKPNRRGCRVAVLADGSIPIRLSCSFPIRTGGSSSGNGCSYGCCRRSYRSAIWVLASAAIVREFYERLDRAKRR
jgi:hypothetical protein